MAAFTLNLTRLIGPFHGGLLRESAELGVRYAPEKLLSDTQDLWLAALLSENSPEVNAEKPRKIDHLRANRPVDNSGF